MSNQTEHSTAAGQQVGADDGATRYVYDLSDGGAHLKDLLGGKGAHASAMLNLGSPVPDGFTVTPSACVASMRNEGQWPAGLADQVREGLARLEQRTGRTLGGSTDPLLVSVRSGAVVSMPGMMEIGRASCRGGVER